MFHLNNNNNRKSQPSSLYGTQWNSPPRYSYNMKAPSKVVSIPVHFVGSERNRADSATKIEKVARGFLVRKSLKKMLKMKVELEEIEKKVNDGETVKMMKKEQKERIRIAETIMNLLLRLDSVRVFHCSALRDLRKSIIKRAIVLQEFVDQIQMVGPTEEVEEGEGKGVELEENCLEKEDVGCIEENEGGKKIEASVNADGEVNCMEKEERGCEEENEGGEKMGSLMNEEKNEDGGEGKCVKEDDRFLMKEEEDGEDEKSNKMEAVWKEEEMEEEDRGCEENEKFDALGNEENNEDGSEGKSIKEEENCLMKENDEDKEKMEVEEKEESVGTSLVEEGIEVSVDVKEEEGRFGNGFEEDKEENCYKEEDGGNRKMLKRMMEDNEKMMEMMAQLFERNEKQTTLLTSLTQRVEQLERAFTCDKLRRKNKKRRNVEAKNRYNGCI